jgi:hypothetical protein
VAGEDDEPPTKIYDPDGSRGVPTRKQKPTAKGIGGKPPVRPPVIETPTDLDAREPIHVISMKTPAGVVAERKGVARRELAVKLRSMAEVRRHDTPVDLGRLAPPRDPRQARARRVSDVVIWACAAIILACGVTLAIWFLARR